MDCFGIVVNGVRMEMLPVMGGHFIMGATQEQHEEAWDNEYPAHEVKLKSYYMGETVVTQDFWRAVMGENGSTTEMPMTGKSWKEWERFINKLNEIKETKFRMPTEAEWENAARGGMKSGGKKYSGSNNLDSVAWFDANSGSHVHQVKQKEPNELGLYDMSGNVWEWCSDWYGSYEKSVNGMAIDNPKGPERGSQRVIRGSSNSYYSRSCRVSCRLGLEPEGKSYNNVSLRLAIGEDEAKSYLETEKKRVEEVERLKEEERKKEEERRKEKERKKEEQRREEEKQREAERLELEHRLENERARREKEIVLEEKDSLEQNATTFVAQSVFDNRLVDNVPQSPRTIDPHPESQSASVSLIDGVDYNRKGIGWAITAVLFTFTGGWLAIIACIVLLGNVRVNGVKYHKYRKKERTLAIVCLILIPFSILLWNIALQS